MRKTTVVIAAAVALVAMIAVPIAFAQHARGMHGEAFGGPMFLGHLQHLKQELGLSDQQASDIKAVFQDLRQQQLIRRKSEQRIIYIADRGRLMLMAKPLLIATGK